MFIAGTGKTACQRNRNGWFLIACEKRGLLYGRGYGKTLLRDDLHGAFDRNSYFSLRLVDPSVVIEKEVFAQVEVRDVLIAIVGLHGVLGRSW